MVRRKMSPKFPYVDLAEAVELAKKLYEHKGNASFPAKKIAATVWGYDKTYYETHEVRRRIAALRRYALISEERQGWDKLTDLALTLILKDSASQEHRDALRVAALAFPLFRKVYETRCSASDEEIIHYLIVDKNFAKTGARRFVKTFRGTIKVAGLMDNVAKTEEEDDSSLDEGEEEHIDSDNSADDMSMMTIPVPLGGVRMATITVPIDMRESEWQRLDRILEAYKPQESI